MTTRQLRQLEAGDAGIHALADEELPAGLRTALIERCATLLRVFEQSDADCTDLLDCARALDKAVGSSLDRLWLARAVIGADLPTDVEMHEIVADFKLDGLWAALRPTLERIANYRRHVDVTVIQDAVTVDVGDTAGSTYLTGIQRVVRETCRRWMAHQYEALYLNWSGRERHLRRLTAEEHAALFDSDTPVPEIDEREVIIPWHGTHLIPELAARPERTARLLPLNRYSGCEVAYIGFDCVPIMAASTVGPGMTTNFSWNLAAIREADRVATISHATADEYRGWRTMCYGRGASGPDIVAVPLPVEAREPSAEELEQARRLFTLRELPIVLVVGSHEPRKNHIAVLHAADLLWRDGLEFTLAIVGGGSWNADQYEATVATLAGAGRSLMSMRALPDHLLWAAYKVADFVVFPSLHEGFGLPVAESLAAGTPVITSDFGSMREIVAPEGKPLGGLLVDPRDDHSIADAMRTLLTDRETAARLAAETRQRSVRTWDHYATELWDYLANGRPLSDKA
ncbi:MAG: glycosyltransferase family 4 protein [Aeromicrobium sp.]